MNLELLDKHYLVYKHTAPNGKVYIGITGFDPKHRWLNNGRGYQHQTTFFNAIIKYGWVNFKHDILYTELTEKEALDKEEELIQKYKSYDRRYGYNISLRGHKYGETINKEINRKLKPKNIPPIPKWNNIGRVVEKKDKNGNILCTYKSVRAVATALNENIETLRTRLNKYKVLDYVNFTLSYGKQEPLPKIQMLTLSGELLKTFKNVSEAYRFLGKINKGHISKACRGIGSSNYLGYKWRYYYENTDNKIA